MSERTVTFIRSTVPALSRVPGGLRQLVAYRELLGFMTINRLRVRYQSSWLGWAWAVLQPLAFLAFLTVVGSAVGGRSNLGVPYPLFILASLSPWTFFATSLSTAAAGVLSSRSLIAKVYFPREIVPLSFVFAALADLAIATALTMVALVCSGHNIPVTVVQLVPISLILIVYAAAFSLALSIAQIGFRDIAIGLPLLLQGMLFTTPVLYPLNAVPPQWRAIYELNPLALLVEAFRGALIGKQIISAEQLIYAAVVGLILFGAAYFMFKTAEPDMVDEI
ncbi:ABC transporter permease [Bradyrhizobium sp. SYSU BS000235]|uniref:ABC transporter permease n=1 Tax=Bradyrhizobium sp. SYSU BS000235 TaxID=3411332 RepID=UPI003C76203E